MFMMTALTLNNIVYQAGEIMSAKAPTEFRLHPIEGVSAHVEITPVAGLTDNELRLGPAGNNIWDNVKINGRHVGNRAAGREEFVRLIVEKLEAVQQI